VPSFQCPSAEWIWFLVGHVLQNDPEELHKFQVKSEVHGGATADACADAAADKQKADTRISVQSSYPSFTREQCQ